MRISSLNAAGLAALFVLGCSDSTGNRLVTVKVSMARSDVAPTAMLVSQDLTSGPIDIGTVTHVNMTLDAVQLQTPGSGGWQTVQPAAAQTIDLMALPGTDLTLDLGEVTLVAGPCQARLFVSDAEVVTEGDVVHTVTKIPSGPQTGLKVDGECTVDEDAQEVTLAFDAGQTVLTIVELPSGDVMLTPVIHIVQH